MSTLEIGQKVLITGAQRMVAEVLEFVGEDDVLVRDERGKRRSVSRSRIRIPAGTSPRHPLERVPNYEMSGGVAVPKNPPEEDPEYMAFVREHPCCSCNAAGPSDPHHWALKGHGEGGMQMKHDDRRTVPLCRTCHDHFHDHRRLPEMSIVSSRIHLLAVQVDLLVKWVRRIS